MRLLGMRRARRHSLSFPPTSSGRISGNVHAFIEFVAEPGEHGCTEGAPATWFEDVLLDLQTALRDVNGRTTPHTVISAINRVGLSVISTLSRISRYCVLLS